MTSHNAATVLFVLATCLAGTRATRAAERAGTRPLVVVELFTSEGCSSCPPADALLAELSKPDAVNGVEIIPLGMHVDYWNQLGWADPFSSPKFSQRQQNYGKVFRSDQIYTPQMIVDGTEEFVGSDKAKASAAIARAATEPKGVISVQLSPISKDRKSAVCQIAVSGMPKNAAGHVLLAITEDELSTDVPRGENAGRKLRHAAVVRTLQEVATLKPGDAAPYSSRITLDLMPGWRLDHLNVAVFVQDVETGKVLAAGQARVLPSP